MNDQYAREVHHRPEGPQQCGHEADIGVLRFNDIPPSLEYKTVEYKVQDFCLGMSSELILSIQTLDP